MTSITLSFPKLCMEECALAALRIRDRFGIGTALEYFVGEKFVNFIEFIRQHPGGEDDLTGFAAGILQLFTPRELEVYLNQLRRTPRGTHKRRTAIRRALLLLLNEHN